MHFIIIDNFSYFYSALSFEIGLHVIEIVIWRLAGWVLINLEHGASKSYWSYLISTWCRELELALTLTSEYSISSMSPVGELFWARLLLDHFHDSLAPYLQTNGQYSFIC
jgi:hypothetical protein